jgi:hypothetical protein
MKLNILFVVCRRLRVVKPKREQLPGPTGNECIARIAVVRNVAEVFSATREVTEALYKEDHSVVGSIEVIGVMGLCPK